MKAHAHCNGCKKSVLLGAFRPIEYEDKSHPGQVGFYYKCQDCGETTYRWTYKLHKRELRQLERTGRPIKPASAHGEVDSNGS
jgi:hypothetical protein